MDSLNQKISEQLHVYRNTSANLTTERQYLLAHLPENENLHKEVKELSVVALHILSSLETGEQTGADLAEAQAVTRGGITRATRKLLKYQMIKSFQSLNDRKKIFYQLTEKGAQLAKAHDAMHRELNQFFERELFADYTVKEKTLIYNFLAQANELEKKLSSE